MTKNSNLIVHMAKVVLFMLFGLFLALVLHEFSHMIVLLMCNGSVEEISIGSQSFVSGQIQSQHIPLVAMSSIVIPTIIAISSLLIKKNFIKPMILSVAMHNCINVAGGIFASFLSPTDNTWDIVLALNTTLIKWPIFVISTICFCTNIIAIFLSVKSIINDA